MDETEDVVCIWRTEFDEEENQCFYGMDIFVRQGNLWRREQEEHLEYAYDLDWLKQQLEQAGFRDVTFYGERTFCRRSPRKNGCLLQHERKNIHDRSACSGNDPGRLC